VAALSVGVELVDETGATASQHLELVRGVALRALHGEGLEGKYEVTLTIVPDDRIRALNREHRGVDEVTDVLSFPLVDQDGAAFVLPPSEPTHLGDVVVALEQARRQAALYEHSFERELAYLTVHGILHLLGYDHEDEGDKGQMRSREEEILAELPREA
jgi:probable rRNA maturation factor